MFNMLEYNMMPQQQDYNNGKIVFNVRQCHISTQRSMHISVWYFLANGLDSFERVEEFIYLGTTLTNQNSIQEEIRSRLKSGNACYHSMQILLSLSLLSKNLKI